MHALGRRLKRVRIALLLATGILWTVGVGPAGALLCDTSSIADKVRPEEKITIFTGTVVERTTSGLVVSVRDWFLGEGAEPQVTLASDSKWPFGGEPEDGRPLEVGVDYFIQTFEGRSTPCSSTAPLSSEAGQRLEREARRLLGEPRHFGPPDTSTADGRAGGFPWGAPIAVAAGILLGGLLERRRTTVGSAPRR